MSGKAFALSRHAHSIGFTRGHEVRVVRSYVVDFDFDVGGAQLGEQTRTQLVALRWFAQGSARRDRSSRCGLEMHFVVPDARELEKHEHIHEPPAGIELVLVQ